MVDKALAVAQPMTIADVRSLAAAFHLSGMFPDIRSEAQALVKIQAGLELGLRPVFSMTHIYVVKGRVMCGAAVLGAALKRSGRYDYRLLEHDDQHCVIAFSEGREEVYRSTWTMDDTRRAGILREDSAWKTYPRAMLFARALTQGVRIVAPEATAGMYAVEEFGGYAEGGRVVIPPTVPDDGPPTISNHVATATADRTAELRERLAAKRQAGEHTGEAPVSVPTPGPAASLPAAPASHTSPVLSQDTPGASPKSEATLQTVGALMTWARDLQPSQDSSSVLATLQAAGWQRRDGKMTKPSFISDLVDSTPTEIARAQAALQVAWGL